MYRVRAVESLDDCHNYIPFSKKYYTFIYIYVYKWLKILQLYLRVREERVSFVMLHTVTNMIKSLTQEKL